jgi:hypothetical protein
MLFHSGPRVPSSLLSATVTMSGPTTITRPQPDYVLLTATLGSEQPQFGLQPDGLWAPGGLAISPDGQILAICQGLEQTFARLPEWHRVTQGGRNRGPGCNNRGVAGHMMK